MGVVAVTWAGFAPPALAHQADICYSPAIPSGQIDKLTNSTVLDCPVAGHRNLPQLAQGGWLVAVVQPVTVDYTVDAATHSPQSATAWMVVVQKESR